MRIIRLLLQIIALISGVLASRRKKPQSSVAVAPVTPALDDLLQRAIASPPDDDALHRLLIDLADDATTLREKLLPHKDALLPPLIALLHSADTHRRELAALALGQLGGQPARDALVSALSDYSHWIRSAAIRALVEINDQSVVSALSPLVNDPDESVRADATHALAHFAAVQMPASAN